LQSENNVCGGKWGCPFDEFIYFDYEKFKGKMLQGLAKKDFASSAKHGVVSGTHRGCWDHV